MLTGITRPSMIHSLSTAADHVRRDELRVVSVMQVLTERDELVAAEGQLDPIRLPGPIGIGVAFTSPWLRQPDDQNPQTISKNTC